MAKSQSPNLQAKCTAGSSQPKGELDRGERRDENHEGAEELEHSANQLLLAILSLYTSQAIVQGQVREGNADPSYSGAKVKASHYNGTPPARNDAGLW